MPQFIPFQFVNSLLTLLITFSLVLWILSVFILPLFPRSQLTRVLVCKGL